MHPPSSFRFDPPPVPISQITSPMCISPSADVLQNSDATTEASGSNLQESLRIRTLRARLRGAQVLSYWLYTDPCASPAPWACFTATYTFSTLDSAL